MSNFTEEKSGTESAVINHDGGVLVTVMKMVLYFHSLSHPRPQMFKARLILSSLCLETGSCRRCA